LKSIHLFLPEVVHDIETTSKFSAESEEKLSTYLMEFCARFLHEQGDGA